VGVAKQEIAAMAAKLLLGVEKFHCPALDRLVPRTDEALASTARGGASRLAESSSSGRAAIAHLPVHR